jgi:hypothetical protein
MDLFAGNTTVNAGTVRDREPTRHHFIPAGVYLYEEGNDRPMTIFDIDSVAGLSAGEAAEKLRTGGL